MRGWRLDSKHLEFTCIELRATRASQCLKKSCIPVWKDYDAPRIRKELGLLKSMDDDVLSCAVIHKIFEIRSKIMKKTESGAIFQIKDCPWADFLDPKVCDIFSEVKGGYC